MCIRDRCICVNNLYACNRLYACSLLAYRQITLLLAITATTIAGYIYQQQSNDRNLLPTHILFHVSDNQRTKTDSFSFTLFTINLSIHKFWFSFETNYSFLLIILSLLGKWGWQVIAGKMKVRNVNYDKISTKTCLLYTSHGSVQ